MAETHLVGRKGYGLANGNLHQPWCNAFVEGQNSSVGNDETTGLQVDLIFQVGAQVEQTINTPLKINGWNMSSWRFGSDHFPFEVGDGCRFQPLIFHVCINQ